jgi:hypothetical protein
VFLDVVWYGFRSYILRFSVTFFDPHDVDHESMSVATHIW